MYTGSGGFAFVFPHFFRKEDCKMWPSHKDSNQTLFCLIA